MKLFKYVIKKKLFINIYIIGLYDKCLFRIKINFIQGIFFFELKFSYFNGEIFVYIFVFYFYEFFYLLMLEKFVLQ